MATKKRTIVSYSDSDYDIQIFHFINHSADVTNLCGLVTGNPELIWELETENGLIKNSKALVFNVNISLMPTATLSIFSMLLNNNSNYDATYSNISGKQLLYAYVYDKNQTQTYYFVIMDSGFDLSDQAGSGSIKLKFSDGLEKSKYFAQFDETGSRTSTWTTAFGTLVTQNRVITDLIQKCLVFGSYDTDLKTWTITIDSVNYPLLFDVVADASLDHTIDEVTVDGTVLTNGTSMSDAQFPTAFDIVTALCYDFQLMLISKGICEFDMVPIFWKSGTELSIEDFGKTLRISKNDKLNTSLTNKFIFSDDSTEIEIFVTSGRYYSSLNTVEKETKLSSILTGLGSNIRAYTGAAYNLIDNTKEATAVLVYGSDSWSNWGKFIFDQFVDTNPTNVAADGYPGLVIRFEKPTKRTTILEFGAPYYFDFKGITYKFYITKLIRGLKSKIDQIEAITVKELV